MKASFAFLQKALAMLKMRIRSRRVKKCATFFAAIKHASCTMRQQNSSAKIQGRSRGWKAMQTVMCLRFKVFLHCSPRRIFPSALEHNHLLSERSSQEQSRYEHQSSVAVLESLESALFFQQARVRDQLLGRSPSFCKAA